MGRTDLSGLPYSKIATDFTETKTGDKVGYSHFLPLMEEAGEVYRIDTTGLKDGDHYFRDMDKLRRKILDF